MSSSLSKTGRTKVTGSLQKSTGGGSSASSNIDAPILPGGDSNTSIDESPSPNKMQTLQTYMALYEKIKDENSSLKDEMKKREHEFTQVTSYLQKDLELKNTQLKNILKKMEDMQEDYENKLRMKDLELNSRKKEFQDSQDTMSVEHEKTREKLKELDELRKEKKEFLEAIRRKEAEIFVVKADFENELTKVKMKFEEEKLLLRSEEELLRRALLEEVHQKAINLVGRKSKEIHQENIELLDQQRILGKDLVEVGQMKTNLEIENKQLSREKRLVEDSMKLYAKQAVKYSREIKELTSRIESLESQLRSQGEMFEREKSDLIASHDRAIDKLRKELAERQNLVTVRTRELVHLKKLAERILQQRTEFEVFFAEAFSHVKNQKVRGQQQQQPFHHAMKSSVESTLNDLQQQFTEFPPIGNNSRRGTRNIHTPSNGGGGGGGSASGSRYNVMGRTTKVQRDLTDSPQLSSVAQNNFSHMTWHEKEMVLKLLFHRINSSATPNTTENNNSSGNYNHYNNSYNMTGSSNNNNNNNMNNSSSKLSIAGGGGGSTTAHSTGEFSKSGVYHHQSPNGINNHNSNNNNNGSNYGRISQLTASTSTSSPSHSSTKQQRVHSSLQSLSFEYTDDDEEE